MVLIKVIKINERNEQSKPFDARIGLEDRLSDVREQLEKEDIMDDDLSFSQKFDNEYVEITRGNEGDFILSDIVGNNSYETYLIKKTEPTYWRFLNKLHILDRGWTISSGNLKRANEPAIILQSAIMEKADPDTIKDVKSSYTYSSKNVIFFISDNEASNMPARATIYEKAHFKINRYKPDEVFIEEVEKATGGNIDDFKKIISRYGQFIPTKFVFGSQENSKYCRNWEYIEFQEPESIFDLVDDTLREKINRIFGKRIIYSEITVESVGKDDVDDDGNIIIKLPESASRFISNDSCSIFATVVGKNNDYHCQILNPPGDERKLIVQCLDGGPDNSKLLVGWIIVGYNTYLTNNEDVRAVQLRVLSKNYPFDSTNDKGSFILELGSSNLEQNHYCIGIPIINDKSDLLIGHHFSNDYNELCTFAYSKKKEKIMELPKFSFDVLVIPNISSHDSTMMLFGNDMNNGIIDIEKNHSEFKELIKFPKFISLCFNKNEQKQILLRQRLLKPITVEFLNQSEEFNYLLFISFESNHPKLQEYFDSKEQGKIEKNVENERSGNRYLPNFSIGNLFFNKST